jgi:hypothetical protein
VRKPNLIGAYGVPRPAPARSTLAHPDRVLRFHMIQQALWAVRIGSVVALLSVLYLFHVIQL